MCVVASFFEGSTFMQLANSLQGSFFMAMRKANIERLYFNQASYFVGDNKGNNILLKVNYKRNRFDLEIDNEKDDNIKILQEEAKRLANDLLRRKSGINFAK